MIALALAVVALQQSPPAVDPLLLKIGSSRTLKVEPGKVVNLRSGREAKVEDIAAAAANTQYVYVGEEHGNLLHHQMQAQVIRALAAAGRHVVIGMEQFTRPNQPNLAGWTLGWYTDDQFITKSDWKNQWGMDYSLYKPVFDAAKDLQLPIVALNIPRDWVRAVGKGGLEALTSDQRSQLPANIDLTNQDHRAIFTAMIGGHPMTGAGMEHMYDAQALWDVAMADTAVKYMSGKSPKTVMVVVAGSGHVMYKQAINWRVKNRTGDPGVTLVMADNDGPREVSRGVGDFFYLTQLPPEDKKP